MRRAAFIARSGALVVTIVVPSFGCAPAQRRPVTVSSGETEDSSGTGTYSGVDSWLAIDRSGEVSLHWGKVELGTGIETAIMQLVADELCVPFERVHVVAIDTSAPNQGYTAASQSLSAGATPVRQAAAVARSVLVRLGAKHLQRTDGELQTQNGYVYVANEPSRRVSYADLLGGQPFNATVPNDPTMMPQTIYKVSGTSVPRIDIPAKLHGTFTFVHDIAVPGMLHGRVVYPPRPGATLSSYDESSLSDIPEKIQVVRKGNFLGVVAREEWHAVRAQRELKVSWSGGTTLPPIAELAEFVHQTPGTERVLVDTGDVDAVMRAAKRTFSARYAWPFQTHGSIGPSCSVADVRPSKVTVWSPTQGVFPLQGAIAELLGRSVGDVRVVYAEGAGCYGHNGADDASAAAALMSQAVGVPVRVQYMRSDETVHDPKNPAMVMEVRAALSADGTIEAWDYHVWSPTHVRRPGGRAGNTLPGILAGAAVAPIVFRGGDFDAVTDYAIPSQRVTITDQPTAVLRQSSMRGLGTTQNTFANESFIDELAHAAGANPIDFRLKHLTDSRMRAVLEALRPNYRKNRGVAFVWYENAHAIVGAVADVSVDLSKGVAHVNHIWIAHDCGLIVNPDGVRNQIEGNAIQATSRAMLEQVKFDRNQVTSVDWDTYPILRFEAIPDVTISLIDRRDQPILGAGEATGAIMAPAIANAIFAQTGKRLRAAPFAPQLAHAT